LRENLDVMDRLDRSIHAHATKTMLGVAGPTLFAARPEFAWMDGTSPSMTAAGGAAVLAREPRRHGPA
ncbi:hypothetical protein, partial [Labrys wisconsinensis]